METAILTAICLIAMGIIFYLLYINGYLITNAKGAIMYIESARGKKASFDSCSGYTRRVVRFRESGTVRFVFDPALSAGSVTAQLLDAKKQMILCLSSANRSAAVQVEAKKRYYLVIQFKSATGRYQIDWEQRNSAL